MVLLPPRRYAIYRCPHFRAIVSVSVVLIYCNVLVVHGVFAFATAAALYALSAPIFESISEYRLLYNFTFVVFVAYRARNQAQIASVATAIRVPAPASEPGRNIRSLFCLVSTQFEVSKGSHSPLKRNTHFRRHFTQPQPQVSP